MSDFKKVLSSKRCELVKRFAGNTYFNVMATTNLIEDIFLNLFTEKYCISVVLDTLASCETNGTLNGLIKRFHPNYFDNKQNKVLELPLLKDLQLL